MPDQYGFDHLPGTNPTVRCIEQGCEAAGLIHEWPERARKRHYRTHTGDRTARAEAQQQSVAAFAEAAAANEIVTHDAEEANTMAKTASTKKASTKPAAKAEGKGRTKRQPRSITALNKILKDDREGYVAYERAHSALKKAEKASDTAEATAQAAVKAEHKEVHSRYWSAYEELRAKKKAAEAAGGSTPPAEAEPEGGAYTGPTPGSDDEERAGTAAASEELPPELA